MTSTSSNISAMWLRSCTWASSWRMGPRNSYTTNPSTPTHGLSFQPFPFPSLEGPGNGNRLEATSPAPSTLLPAASSRGAAHWSKIAAGKKKSSSIPSKTAEESAVGRYWGSESTVGFQPPRKTDVLWLRRSTAIILSQRNCSSMIPRKSLTLTLIGNIEIFFTQSI